jgi:hypothetical protein
MASDGTTEVFRVNVGGADVGDVIQGNYAGGQGTKWDQSAGQFLIAGILAASGGIKTASTGSRIELGTFDSNQRLRMYSGTTQCVDVRLEGGEPVIYINSSGSSNFVRIDTSGFLYAGGSWSVLMPRVQIGYSSVTSPTGYPYGNYVEISSGSLLSACAFLSEALYIGSDKVIGARGAAVADATDAASVILRLNDLLARCRAHGLIAT